MEPHNRCYVQEIQINIFYTRQINQLSVLPFPRRQRSEQ